MTVLAASLAAVAVALALSGRPRLPAGKRPWRPAVRGGGMVHVALTAALVVLVAVAEGRHLFLGLVLLGVAAGVGEQVRRVRRSRAAERRQRQVVEVCEALVGELRAGQPVVTSLEHCEELWPEIRSVVMAGRLGADVPAALRRLARSPGAEGLRDVASAWVVAEQSGAGLAAALSQVAATARARQSTRHLVQGELASAQATARLVTLLPFAALAMSAGIGGDPWHFLLATPPGLACLAAGVALVFCGLFWIDRIATGVLRT